MRITLGPKEKKERRLGEQLGLKGARCAGPKCAALRRPYPPGVHGPGRKKRLTAFGLQLKEKQKMQLSYGLAERQLRNYALKAMRKRGDSQIILGQLLERRLDTIVYRLGFARSQGEAREYVSHGHFLVNGKKVNIPSFTVRAGDLLEIKSKSRENKFFKEIMVEHWKNYEPPSWLVLDKKTGQGRVLNTPLSEDLPQKFNRTMVIEFYSR